MMFIFIGLVVVAVLLRLFLCSRVSLCAFVVEFVFVVVFVGAGMWGGRDWPAACALGFGNLVCGLGWCFICLLLGLDFVACSLGFSPPGFLPSICSCV